MSGICSNCGEDPCGNYARCTNNQPYLILELDEQDAEWLVKHVATAAAQIHHDLFNIYNASGDSDIGRNRVLLQSAAHAEQAGVEFMMNKLLQTEALKERFEACFAKFKTMLAKHNPDYADYLKRLNER